MVLSTLIKTVLPKAIPLILSGVASWYFTSLYYDNKIYEIQNEHSQQIENIQKVNNDELIKQTKAKDKAIDELLKKINDLDGINSSLNNRVAGLQYKLKGFEGGSSSCENRNTSGVTEETREESYRLLREGVGLLSECGRTLRENAVKHDALVNIINTSFQTKE